MFVCVMRILKGHFREFDTIKVQQHIQHEYSKEMSEKSRVTCLGTIDANPSSHEGVQLIMDTLHHYVPETAGGDLLPLLINGDGLSMDRTRTAKINRCRAPTASTRLQGLVLSPQEFHLEALLLQVLWDYEFFNMASNF